MKREVKHLVGREITDDVISRINFMAMKRYDEGVFSVLYEGVDTLEELCLWHGALPEQENVLLGEDWVVVYVKRDNEIDFVEWLDLEEVDDKFSQTMEMVKAIRNVLIEGKDSYLYADMRHDTSYQFYKTMQKSGYLETYSENVGLDESAPSDVLDFADDILDEFGSYNEYFSKCGEDLREDYGRYFHHDIAFGVTEKFVKRYVKD